jgi:hypothetical protein
METAAMNATHAHSDFWKEVSRALMPITHVFFGVCECPRNNVSIQKDARRKADCEVDNTKKLGVVRMRKNSLGVGL